MPYKKHRVVWKEGWRVIETRLAPCSGWGLHGPGNHPRPLFGSCHTSRSLQQTRLELETLSDWSVEKMSSFLAIPPEVMDVVCDVVDRDDLPALRLTCKGLCVIFSEPFARAYLEDISLIFSEYSTYSSAPMAHVSFSAPHPNMLKNTSNHSAERDFNRTLPWIVALLWNHVSLSLVFANSRCTNVLST